MVRKSIINELCFTSERYLIAVEVGNQYIASVVDLEYINNLIHISCVTVIPYPSRDTLKIQLKKLISDYISQSVLTIVVTRKVNIP